MTPIRSLLVGSLVLCATATLAPSAYAVDYTVDACRHADGTPAPTDTWTPVINDDHPTGDIAAGSCAQGGHIDLALGAGTHTKAGGPASVLVNGVVPPGATWTRLQAWLAYKASPTTAGQDTTHRVALTVAGTVPCGWGMGGAGCSQFGSFSAPPLSEVNRLTVTPTSPGQSLSVGVLCDSSPDPCPATSGDPYAMVRIWRLAVTINDPATTTPPPGSSEPTPPATPGTPAPAPGKRVHNGSGTATTGKLTIRLRRHGNRLRLTGRLMGDDRKPIARARLVLRRQTRGRRAVFTRVVTRRNGTFSRVLPRSSRRVRVVVRWYPWRDRSTQPIVSRTLRYGRVPR